MKLDLEGILEMWKKDCVIEEMNLDEESRKTPSLHAKYLEIHSLTKLRMKKAELDQKILLKINGYTITAKWIRKLFRKKAGALIRLMV